MKAVSNNYSSVLEAYLYRDRMMTFGMFGMLFLSLNMLIIQKKTDKEKLPHIAYMLNPLQFLSVGC